MSKLSDARERVQKEWRESKEKYHKLRIERLLKRIRKDTKALNAGVVIYKRSAKASGSSLGVKAADTLLECKLIKKEDHEDVSVIIKEELDMLHARGSIFIGASNPAVILEEKD